MKWYPWLLLAVVIASLMPTLAYPHDEWDWIRQNPETAHCCSEIDCRPLNDIRVAPGGWSFTNPFSGKQTYVDFDFPHRPSKDPHNRFWACFNLHAEAKPVREGCFFLPETGI